MITKILKSVSLFIELVAVSARVESKNYRNASIGYGSIN